MKDNFRPTIVLILFSVMYGCCAVSVDSQQQETIVPYPSYINSIFKYVPQTSPSEINSGEGQLYMQYLAMVGREDIRSNFDNWRDGSGPCLSAIESSDDVIEEIALQAQKTRILIINEAHDQPQHRAFIQKVALRVREQGYSVFAAEAFSEHIASSEHLPFAKWIFQRSCSATKPGF